MGWLDWLIIPPCPLCQRPARTGSFCQDCTLQLQASPYHPWKDIPPPPFSLPVYSWGVYTGSLRRALQQLKYNHQSQIGLALGSWMAQRWQTDPHTRHEQRLTVVPIPLHPDKLKTRGYNQAELLSRGFTEQTGLRHQPQILARIRSTEAQFGLTVEQRQKNLHQAFQVLRKPETPVLLVDDIFTTGSTLASAHQVFQAQGIRVIGAVVAARPLYSGVT